MLSTSRRSSGLKALPHSATGCTRSTHIYLPTGEVFGHRRQIVVDVARLSACAAFGLHAARPGRRHGETRNREVFLMKGGESVLRGVLPRPKVCCHSAASAATVLPSVLPSIEIAPPPELGSAWVLLCEIATLAPQNAKKKSRLQAPLRGAS